MMWSILNRHCTWFAVSSPHLFLCPIRSCLTRVGSVSTVLHTKRTQDMLMESRTPALVRYLCVSKQNCKAAGSCLSRVGILQSPRAHMHVWQRKNWHVFLISEMCSVNRITFILMCASFSFFVRCIYTVMLVFIFVFYDRFMFCSFWSCWLSSWNMWLNRRLFFGFRTVEWSHIRAPLFLSASWFLHFYCKEDCFCCNPLFFNVAFNTSRWSPFRDRSQRPVGVSVEKVKFLLKKRPLVFSFSPSILNAFCNT